MDLRCHLARVKWRTKILGLSGLLLSFCIIVSAGGSYFIRSQDALLQQVLITGQQRGDVAFEMADAIVELDRALQTLITATGADNIHATFLDPIRRSSILEKHLRKLTKTSTDLPEAAELERVLDDIRPLQQQAVKAARRDEDEVARTHMLAAFDDTTRAIELSNTIAHHERESLNQEL